MCSRYALFKSKTEILDELTPLLWTADYRPNWNVAPTTAMPVLRTGGQELVMDSMTWGVKPPWSPQVIVNARSESMREKPTFRQLVEAGQFGLVPMDAYFEWRREGRARVPFMIRQPHGGLLCAAGLWELDVAGPRFVIITRSAFGGLAAIHDRMPVFVSHSAAGEWLGNGELDVDAVPDLEMVEIHSRINSVRTQGPSAIEIVPTQPELF